jgi:L-aspartate oxidase
VVNLPESESAASVSFPDRFDVLVVGAGAAGLYTALNLPPHLQVGLITKEDLPQSASDWAQGGIAAAIDPEDSPTLHIQDTLNAGAGLCDLAAVTFLAQHAPQCIRSLVELGVAFDRQGEQLALTLEAAHSRRRVLHAADTTGRAVVSILGQQVRQRPNIQVLSHAFAIDLWLHPDTGRCQGVSLAYADRVQWVRSGAVILATGGGGQVFAQTTNPAVSTGDGVAIGWRSGVQVRDLEFVQFHPTALTKPGAPRFLISEAVRGEGAHLVDASGRRFAFDYHPDGELAPRDVVSRSIFRYLQSPGVVREASSRENPADAHVWLDFRSIEPDRIRHRFPNIIQVCREWGIDVFKEPVPVSPAAHYWMGGITTDLNGRSSIPGLYAVGETASTGVHGANRLASNSLLECLVFGAQLAEIEVAAPAEGPEASTASKTIELDWKKQQETLDRLRSDLPRLLWKSAGICREESTMQVAIDRVSQWRSEFEALPLTQQLTGLAPLQSIGFSIPNAQLQLRYWGETRNLLDIAYLILKSAAFRTESRGGHYRSDFPETDSNWQVHTVVQGDGWWKF